MAPVLVPNPPADDAPHLLVVDDDRRIRDLLSRFLFNMIAKEERLVVETLLPEPIEAAAASRRK